MQKLDSKIFQIKWFDCKYIWLFKTFTLLKIFYKSSYSMIFDKKIL